jgi:hypothetical protein
MGDASTEHTTDCALARPLRKHESITDHQTKALRAPADHRRDREPAHRDAAVLHYRGPFRVYFNRKEEAPRLISIDNGTHSWEIVCKTVKIESLALKSMVNSGAEYPSPIFALEGVGSVQVDENGQAVIS